MGNRGLQAYREFGGVKLYPIAYSPSKKQMQDIAGKCRKGGYSARVVKVGSDWVVYTSKQGIKKTRL